MGDPVPWRGRGHADCRGPGRLDSCGRDGSLFPGSQLPLWTRKRPGKSWAAGWPPSSQRGLRFLRQSPGRRRSVGAQPRALGGSQAPWCGSSALSTSPLAGSCWRCSKRTLGAGTSRQGQRRGTARPSELCQARSCLSVAKQAVGGTVRSRSPSPGLWTVTAPLGGLPRSGPGPGPHRALHRTGGVCTRLLPASPGASSRAVTATRFPSPRVNDLPTDALASGCEKPIQWAWSHLSSI